MKSKKVEDNDMGLYGGTRSRLKPFLDKTSFVVNE